MARGNGVRESEWLGGEPATLAVGVSASADLSQGCASDVGTADGGPDDVECAMNDRMCIVSRKTFEPDRLIRFVAGPDGAIVADLRRRLPGRGAYVEARRAVVEQAVRRKLFGRALKVEAKGFETLGSDLDEQLRRNALGFLGLTRKAGQLVTGATKVDLAVRAGAALAVLHAVDAAPDGIRKLDGARRAAVASGACDAVLAFRFFSADELGLAFGGGNVIHAAVLAGDAGSALLKRLEALATYRDESPGAMVGDDRQSPDGAP